MADIRLPFVKAVGAGNDFVFFMAAAIERVGLEISEVTAATTRICDRHWGVGSDGIIILHPEGNPISNVRWDFYNADGSEAEMCGNAARCVGAVLAEMGPLDPLLVLETQAGPVKIQSEKMGYRVVMPNISSYRDMSSMFNSSQILSALYVNTGVPHLVLQLAAPLEPETWRRQASQWRSDSRLGPAGANVTFFWKESGDIIGAVTFERGVEDFTLACGTGASAAAFAFSLLQNDLSIGVEMPGGRLNVTFDSERVQCNLSGPAEIVYSGVMNWRTKDA